MITLLADRSFSTSMTWPDAVVVMTIVLAPVLCLIAFLYFARPPRDK